MGLISKFFSFLSLLLLNRKKQSTTEPSDPPDRRVERLLESLKGRGSHVVVEAAKSRWHWDTQR